MAVLVQFTTLLVRIDRLLAVDPAGLARIEARWSPSWRDEHLLAVAFMDMGARDLAGELEQMGLILRDTSSGTRVWRDICIVDYYEGPTNPCPWLEYDPARHAAWQRGTPPGELVGPQDPHEDAPIRVSPEQMQRLMQQQHPARQTAAKPTAALMPSHEARLLPLVERLAPELLRRVPHGAQFEGLVFIAEFPRPGEVVQAGRIFHTVAGERRMLRIEWLSDMAGQLLTTCSRHDSGQRLTSLELRISGDGETTTRFGIAAPRDDASLQAHMDRLFGNIPEARVVRPKPAGCLFGWLPALFGAKALVRPLPAPRHVPQTEPLSLLLDELEGIDEGWHDERPAPAASSGAAPSFDLAALHDLEAARAAAPALTAIPTTGEALTVPATEGVLLTEARTLRRVAVSELQRARPELRFDPISQHLGRDLGPELGVLRFGIWNGEVTRLHLHTTDLPSFDVLLARLRPVLVALGGMGPLASALGSRSPADAGQAAPIDVDTLRRELVHDSAYGRRVHPFWLLGGPPHTRVSLELSVGLRDGAPSFGCLASVVLV